MAKNEMNNEEQSNFRKKHGVNLVWVTKFGIVAYLVIAIVLSAIAIFTRSEKTETLSKNVNLEPELTRAMTYEQFSTGSDDVYDITGENKVDNVKFSSFFLRDLDGDGDAEKVKRNV